ncbi:LysM peptidoglycan-binding domain-containing protein [Macrococcus hajekii]|uniref:LysM peptidoglycan-binding domain-containing protein n=1 Tax=Macrococcus hajekii TaxID=198482 RepID=A0A4R6BI71_9STAP|nr:LysM peptidoglycan-binding domain-containing protein [Macrococcus hajekii]TDM01166.1 LysM peptidoglycan-binding domain-containing protein [Macrococcus hajekii]GGB12007.1 N-acetylmuramoyl-L-alanine amidase sle1 [Macrococcus hajekii]
MRKKVYALTATAGACALYSYTADASEYTVKPNDSLWQIAMQYNTSVTELKTLNNLSSNLIFVNQKLQLPGTTGMSSSTTVRTPTNTTSTQISGYHTVQAGESLSVIAAKYGTTYTNIMRLNNLNSYLIFPGQRLKVSGTSITQSPASVPSRTTTPVISSAPTGKYTVKSGDSLSLIGSMFKVSVADLQRWNGLNSYLIFPNQQLIVSGGTATTSTPVTQTPVPVQNTVVTTGPVFNHPNLYDYGQCTWHVFNRRAAIGKGISTYWWNANNWANGARNDGYVVDHTPAVGAIAQTTMGPLGHVAFVERVNPDGTILVSEMNYLTVPTVVGYRTLNAYQMSQYVFIH